MSQPPVPTPDPAPKPKRAPRKRSTPGATATAPAPVPGGHKTRPAGTGTGTGKTGKKPPPAGTPGGAPPRKRRAHKGRLVASTVVAQALEAQLGEPLETALSGVTPAIVQQSTNDFTDVAAQMTLPAPIQSVIDMFLGKPYSGQFVLSYMVARGLLKFQGPGGAPVSKVAPATLLETRGKQDVVTRAYQTVARGQNYAADTRLYLGARFTFLLSKTLGLYKKKLTDPGLSRGDKMKLVSDFSRLISLLSKTVDQRAATQGDTQAQISQMEQDLQDQLDEVAFLSAKLLLDKGDTPDAGMLLSAQRHAKRINAAADQAVIDEALGSDRRNSTRSG